MVRHPTHDRRSHVSITAGAKSAGAEFMHIMEGRKGEQSRDVVVYDLDQRRRIDEEIVRRTIDFMTRSVKAGRPFYAYVPFTLVHFPTLPNPRFAGTTGHGDFVDSLAEMDANVGPVARCGGCAGDPEQHHRRLHERQRP